MADTQYTSIPPGTPFVKRYHGTDNPGWRATLDRYRLWIGDDGQESRWWDRGYGDWMPADLRDDRAEVKIDPAIWAILRQAIQREKLK